MIVGYLFLNSIAKAIVQIGIAMFQLLSPQNQKLTLILIGVFIASFSITAAILI
jgi:hypothetical protein